MKTFKWLLLLIAISACRKPGSKYILLCLGDSYTIGQSVKESERYAEQTVELLNKDSTLFDEPVIIARSGWTTDELMAGIKERYQNLPDRIRKGEPGIFVTLLIGTNDQFRERDTGEYRKEFAELVDSAFYYAGNNGHHVFVLSLPNWGLTPYAANDPQKRSPEQIGTEIDRYNEINKEEAEKAKVNYVDIAPFHNDIKSHPDLIATDGLHPSWKLHARWAGLLAEKIKSVIAMK